MAKFKLLRDDNYIAIYKDGIFVGDFENDELDLILRALDVDFTEHESDIDWLDDREYAYPKNFSDVVTV